MQPGKLLKIPRAQREEKLRCLSEAGVTFPSKFCLEVLACQLREKAEYFACGDNQENALEQWVQKLDPMKEPEGELDILLPGLAHLTDLDSVNKARALSKLVLKDTLIPLIALGEQGKESLHVWCKALVTYFSNVRKSSCIVTTASVSEVIQMCQALLSLVDGKVTQTQQVVEVMGCQSGNKFLLKAAVLQNKHYKTLYNDYLQADSMRKHLQPSMQKASENLKAGKEGKDPMALLNALEDATKQLSLWRNKLKPGDTLEIEAEIADGFDEILKSIKAGELTEEGLTQSTRVIDLASRGLLTDALRQHGVTNEKYEQLSKIYRVATAEMLKKRASAGLGVAVSNFTVVATTICNSKQIQELYPDHDVRMSSYSGLTSALSQISFSVLDEPLQTSLQEAYVKLVSALGKILHSAISIAVWTNLDEECGKLMAEASVLQALGKSLETSCSHPRPKMQVLIPFLELSNFIRELRAKMTPVTPSSKRATCQIMNQLKDMPALEVDTALLAPCAEQLKAVQLEAATLLDDSKAHIRQHLEDTLKALTEELRNGLQAVGDWKQKLKETSRWKDVVSAGKVLMDPTVCQPVVKHFTSLKKDPCS